MATYHYHYDPLDRLIQTAGIQRFYNQSRITTEIEGTQSYSVFQHDGQLLAQRRRDRTKDECHLLGTDFQQSVLHAVSADKHHSMAYNAYGHRPVENGLISLLGFNGERPDPVTGHYLLGQGHRAYNPVLMRFNSPDSLSPFGKGGLNAYAYCSNNPVTRRDPTGKNWATSIFARLRNKDDLIKYMPGLKSVVSEGMARHQDPEVLIYNFLLNRYRGSPSASVSDLKMHIGKNTKDIQEIKGAIAVQEVELQSSKVMRGIYRDPFRNGLDMIEKEDFLIHMTTESVRQLKKLKALSEAHLSKLKVSYLDKLPEEPPPSYESLYPPGGISRSSPAEAASNIRRN